MTVIKCKDCGIQSRPTGQKYPPYCVECYWKRKDSLKPLPKDEAYEPRMTDKDKIRIQPIELFIKWEKFDKQVNKTVVVIFIISLVAFVYVLINYI